MSENIFINSYFTAWVTLSELRPKASQIKKVLTPDLFKTVHNALTKLYSYQKRNIQMLVEFL